MCFHLGECCILTDLSFRYHNGRVLVFNSICFLNFGIDNSTVRKAKKQRKQKQLMFPPISVPHLLKKPTNYWFCVLPEVSYTYTSKHKHLFSLSFLLNSHILYILFCILFFSSNVSQLSFHISTLRAFLYFFFFTATSYFIA